MANNEWYYYYQNPEQGFQEILIKSGLSPNDIIFFMDLINTRLAMFRFPNLDKGGLMGDLTSMDVNRALLLMTDLCFANVPSLGGWMLCTYCMEGELSPNRHPTYVRLIALNGSNIPGIYRYSDIVPIYDNNLRIPRIITLMAYIRKIKELDDDVFKLCEVATLPAVITGDKKQANAMREIAKSLNIRNPFIIGDSSLAGQVQTFDIRLTINPLDIYDLKSKYKNEALSSMGIYNVEQKRERIVTQELVNQNDFSDFTYNASVILLKQVVESLKAKSGLDIGFEELYDFNQRENLILEKDKTKALAKAEAEGTKEGDPDANKGGLFK